MRISDSFYISVGKEEDKPKIEDLHRVLNWLDQGKKAPLQIKAYSKSSDIG
jgi:hypothetical protein